MGKSRKRSGGAMVVAAAGPAADAAASVSEGKSGRRKKKVGKKTNAEDEIETNAAAVSAKKQKTTAPAQQVVDEPVTPRKAESSTSEGEPSDSGEEKPAAAQLKKPSVASAQKKTRESNNSSDGSSDSDGESDDDLPAKAPVEMKRKEGSSESSDSKSESVSEGEDNNNAKKKEESSDSSESDSESDETTGSKTIYVWNLSYSIERKQVKQFFEEAGEVVDVRLSTFEDGSFKGYGHVEFTTAEAAQKALGFTNHDLMGQPVKVDLASERSGYTPGSGPFKSAPPRPRNSTAYIEGFDTSIGEDQMRSALQEHFRSCGEITRVSIPKDGRTGSSKGIAYIEFKDPDSLDKAYQLNASDLGGYLLYVDEAYDRQ